MIFKTKVKEHRTIKDKLVRAIENAEGEAYESIEKTDWHLQNVPKEYMHIAVPIIKPYIRELIKHLYKEHHDIIKANLSNSWYQIYKKNSQHTWHTHTKTQLANVYLIELPEKKYATKFLNHKTVNLEEGDILTFPSWYLHSSPIIKSNKRKIIIAYNLDMECLI
tara:strand:- start:266 stop:760 length:495 start_codon:yes stop_codon:yes gene_type:complete